MSIDESRERLRRLHLGATAVVVLADGGVSYFASALGLLLFSLILMAGASQPVQRPVLRRIRVGSLLIAVAIAAWAVWQAKWIPSGEGAHPAWRNLAEAFGETGGARSVMKMQPLWEIPGTVLPFIAIAAGVPLYRSERSANEAWLTIALAGGAFAVWGILQLTLFPTWNFGDKHFYQDSLTGTYVNRNVAAAFLVMTSLATLVVISRALDRIAFQHLWRVILRIGRVTGRDRRLALFVLLFLVQLVALVLTKSRAGSVIGILAIALFVGLRLPHHVDPAAWKRSRTILAVAAIVLVGFLWLLTGRVAQRLDIQGLEDTRWCVYPAMWQMAVDALPWGVGLGGVVAAFPPYRRAECGLSGTWDSAHDGYLQGLATMGVLFPIVVMVALGLVLPPVVGGLRRHGTPRSLSTASLIALGAMALHAIVDFPLEIPGNAIVLAILCLSAIGAATGPRSMGRVLSEKAADGQKWRGRDTVAK